MNTVRTFLAKDTRPAPASDGCLAEQVDRRVSSPEELAAASELDGAISAAMATLSPALRAAIVLTSVNGCSVGEAARTEGCPVPTMYWRVHKARKILRRRLASYLSDMPEDAENC
jgi:DNA-directed RNA polymerase specialized sigma24 family protein